MPVPHVYSTQYVGMSLIYMTVYEMNERVSQRVSRLARTSSLLRPAPP